MLVSSIHGPLQTVDLQLLILSQRVVDSNFSLYVITHHATYLTSLSDSLWTSSTKLTKCLTDGQFFLLIPSLYWQLQNIALNLVAMILADRLDDHRQLSDLRPILNCPTMSAIGINGFGRIGRLVLRLEVSFTTSLIAITSNSARG